MNLARNLLLCCLSLCLLHNVAQAQDEWSDITPPPLAAGGGFIGGIHVDDAQLLVIAGNSIFRSTDQGRSWETEARVVAGQTTVTALAFINGVWLAGGDARVSRSEDGGRSWVRSDAGMIFRTDGAPATIAFVRQLAVNGNLVAAIAEVVNSRLEVIGAALYVSQDTGRSWRLLLAGVSTESLLPVTGGLLFVSAQGNLLRLDSNTQAIFQVDTLPPEVARFSRRLASAGGAFFLYGGIEPQAITGLYRSTDQGRNWSSSNAGIFEICQGRPVRLSQLAVGGNNLFAAGSLSCGIVRPPQPLYVSLNNGAHWEKITPPVPAGIGFSVTSLAATADHLFVAVQAPDNRKLFRRRNLFTAPPLPLLTTVSAASFRQYDTARGGIVSLFGVALSPTTLAATTLPLPLTLGGVSVSIKDRSGVERTAPLFFVSPTQINCLIPAETELGEAVITVKNAGVSIAAGAAAITHLAPALFTADASGSGLPASSLLRVKAGGAQVYEPIARFDAAQNRFVPIPIELGPETDELFLILFGTGLGDRKELLSTLRFQGCVNIVNWAEVVFAGSAPGFAGLSQVNLRLPRNQGLSGVVDILLRADDQASNAVRLVFK